MTVQAYVEQAAKDGIINIRESIDEFTTDIRMIVIGNVFEWCEDWYGDYSSDSQSDPIGAVSGSFRVYRGGSRISEARLCRVSYRLYNAPNRRNSILGFRLVCSFPTFRS